VAPLGAGPAGAERNRYADLLRTGAIGFVVVGHQVMPVSFVVGCFYLLLVLLTPALLALQTRLGPGAPVVMVIGVAVVDVASSLCGERFCQIAEQIFPEGKSPPGDDENAPLRR
jgi:hypothetical protein